MRSFLALPVAEPALGGAVALLERLRTAIPDVRWVRDEGLHLTLHFFGELPEDAAPAMLDAVRTAVAAAPAYEAELGGLGCFPREGDERVLWMGMRRGAAETAALQSQVESTLGALGFPREQRPFSPHVTLGRPRQRFTAAVRRRWGSFGGESLPPFTVRELCLYRSHMGAGGSRYEVIARLPLAG